MQGKPLKMIVIAAILAAVYGAEPLLADQFHYSNLLMGDRAMGMGGAFCAVADDASGLVYNPAGIAFAQSNEISASGNAFYQRQQTYKKTIGQKDYLESSKGSVAPFLGSLVKLENLAPGLAFAFGFFNRDAELKTQDDLIENELNISRFHRTQNIRAQTGGFGVAASKRLFSSLAAGVSLSYLTVDELVQDYQDALIASDADTAQLSAQNLRQRLEVSIVEIGMGLQYSLLPNVSLGVNFKVPTTVSQNFENGFEQTVMRSPIADGFNVPELEGTPIPVDVKLQGRTVAGKSKIDNPFGGLPSEYRLGLAWFASTGVLWTMDVSHYTAIKGDLDIYTREAVTNYATGLEWYITPNVPVRFGVFTNNDARPDIDETKTDQADHIDYTGYSMFFVWAQPNSQVALGGIYQGGKGKAQKIAGSTAVQDVEATSYTIAFSATQNI